MHKSLFVYIKKTINIRRVNKIVKVKTYLDPKKSKKRNSTYRVL